MPDFLKVLEYGAKALRGAVNSVPMPRRSVGTPAGLPVMITGFPGTVTYGGSQPMPYNASPSEIHVRSKAPDAAGANSASVMDAPAGSPQPAGAVPTQHIHDVLLGIAEEHHDRDSLSDALDWTCVCGHPLPDGDPYTHLRVHVAELQAAAIHNLISK